MTAGIMGYVGSTTPLNGMGNVGCIPDFANNLIYFSKDGAGSAGGIRQMVGYSSGDELAVKTAATLALSNGWVSDAGGGQCLSYGGRIVAYTLVSGGSALISLVSTTLSGLVQGPTLPINANVYSMAPIRYGTTDFVLFSMGNSTPKHMYYADLTTLTGHSLGDVDENAAVVGRGAINPTSGTGFVLGKDTAGNSTAALGLYLVTITNSSQTMSKKGTVTPAQVDATWTHFQSVTGVAYDQVDGNPIIEVSTLDAATHQHYLVKLNATNAAVIWTVPLPGNGTLSDDGSMTRSVVSAQVYIYIDNSQTAHSINTNTGVDTTSGASVLTIGGQQISEDVSGGSVIFHGGWAEGSTHPTYFGTYMGTNGNHTLSSQWGRWFPGYPPAHPPAPPVIPQPNPGVSLNRAWTFVLDGHTFYVLDLGQEGTFAYDIITQEWSQFTTSNLGNWNMINGVMWGQRIIAGDLSTSDIWELVPSAVKDSLTGAATADIAHVVTGGLTVRNRTYYSVDSVRVTASWGQLQDVAGVNITLSYSDDFGQTFTNAPDVPLTEGAYTTEIVWRSLGSFTQPGRIFKISDTGGPLRIDAADAAIEDFDEDNLQGKQQ